MLLLLTGCGISFNPAAGWSGVVEDGGTFYVGSMEGRLLALDGEGDQVSLRWSFPPEGQRRLRAIYGTPAVADGRVFVGEYDDREDRGAVYGVEVESQGTQFWEIELDGAVVSGITVAQGVVLVGSSDKHLYALDAATGAELWRFPTQGKVWSTPVVAGNLVYFGSLDHRVYAVWLTGRQAGTPAWPTPFETRGAVAATPLVVGDTVYVGSFDRTLYALDAQTGIERWRFKADNWFWSGAVADEDTVYVGSLGGQLYALDAQTGLERWPPFETDGPILATPLLLEQGVLVASDKGQVYLLDRASGQRISSLSVGDHIRAPLRGLGQRAYFQAMDHTIRALSIDPWFPAWCFNTKHAGDLCS